MTRRLFSAAFEIAQLRGTNPAVCHEFAKTEGVGILMQALRATLVDNPAEYIRDRAIPCATVMSQQLSLKQSCDKAIETN
jgi:hypothetical protein